MTIRFATARPITAPAHLTRRALGRIAALAANDNLDLAMQDSIVREALRHFALHGLKAAKDAGERARIAHKANDPDALRHWLQVCTALDARLAVEVNRSLRHKRV